MTLKNDIELAVTQKKLAGLQERYDSIRQETKGDSFVREVTLRSLKKMMNQMIEEITLYEIHAGAAQK